jgi:hypothetical protein
MDTVQEYLEALQQHGEETLRSRLRHPVLLYPEKHGSRGFSTYHTRMADRGVGSRIAGGGQEMRAYHVLAPPEDRPAGGKLLVGRGSEREYNIDHSTVSKRHAVILFDEERKAYQLGDAGSTNGTLLNGQAVESGAPVYLRDGNVVSFGDCDYLFFSPDGFIDLLKRLNA